MLKKKQSTLEVWQVCRPVQSCRSWRTHTGLGSVDIPRRRTWLFPIKTSQLIFESTLPQLRRQQLGAQGFYLSIYLSICLSIYLILSYPILSYLILSYPILSYLILSYPILSYLVLSCPILSYLILSYLVYLYLSLPADLFWGQFLIPSNLTRVAHQVLTDLTRNAE